MIESVYNSENGDVNRTSKVQSTIKMPKNIRQMGKSTALKKIYVEDYVMTFIKQLADYESCKIAILVGQNVKNETGKCIFISGAIEVTEVALANEIVFTNDTWTGIYETMKQYFIDTEIVGWFIGGPTYQLEDKERIMKAHINNFAGQEKTLLTYDSIEKEESFHFYENNALTKQEGYYIYYEKNEEMQNYMIAHAKPASTEEEYVDKVSKEIRNVIKQKKSAAMEENKNSNRMVYAVGTLLAVIILIVGAALLNNHEQIKTMRKAMESISKNWDVMGSHSNGVNESLPTMGGQVASSPSDDNSQLDVNVIAGGVTPIEEEVTKVIPPKKEDEDATQPVKIEDDTEVVKNNTTESKKEVKYYTVKSGDSLAGIAYKLYNSANYIAKIKKLNDIEDEDMIYIGQKLIVP